jgi:hypothetical protein
MIFLLVIKDIIKKALQKIIKSIQGNFDNYQNISFFIPSVVLALDEF